MEILKVENLRKEYGEGNSEVVALDGVNLEIERGEFVAIVGPSGSGKSTLLHIIGGVDSPDDGKVYIDGNDISKYSSKELAYFRRRKVGLIYQFYNLIPNLTAKENVELAAQIVPDAMSADDALQYVDLGQRENNFPAQLSGGEQQRVAIARAIAKKPALLLCDEPTGALDYKTGKRILKILQNMSRQNGSTVLIVTHNAAIAPIADKVIRIHDGSIQKVQHNLHPADISTIEW